MKKRLFLEAVRNEAAKLTTQKAQMAVTMAICIIEDSLPGDVEAAARRFVTLVSRLRREVPAQ